MLQPPNNSLTLMVKGCFDLVENDRACFSEDEDAATVMGDVFVADNPDASLHYANDFVVYKPKADLTLSGVAYPQAGKGGCKVTFAVGEWKKSLAIFNDRFWHWGSASQPEPFSAESREIPLTYENAYGGDSFLKNPVGKGAKHSRGDADDNSQPLPNIENVDYYLTSPSQKTDPAGFAPLKTGWGDRTALTGTYGDKWLKEEFPGFPKDFNWGYFNTAPQDQQVDYLSGDETLYFENLRPETPSLSSKLPAIRPRLFVTGNVNKQEIFSEITLRLDTLHVDMESQKVYLLWRGLVGVQSDEYEELSHACLFHENMAEQMLPHEHYHAQFQASLAATDEPFEIEEFEDEQGEELAIPEVASELADEADATEEVSSDSIEHIFSQEMAQLKQKLKESGTSAEILDLLSLDMNEDVFSHKVFENYSVSPEDGENLIAKSHQDAAAFMAEQGHDLTELTKATESQGVEAPDNVVEITSKSDKIDKMLAENASFEEMDLVGVDLSNRDLSGVNFRQADLTKANLSGANLCGADFTDADLSNAKLQYVIAQKTIFNNAILDQVDASFADFSNSSFISSQCQRVVMIKANFSDAALSYADFSHGTLPGGNFLNASLLESIFEGADLSQSQFEQIDAVGCDFSDANLREVFVSKSNLRQANFASSRLSLAIFEYCELSEAIFETVEAPKVMFTECTMNQTRAGEESNFLGAKVTGGSAVGIIFEGNNLQDAMFSQISLQSSDFSSTNLSGAVFDQCDMKLANFKKADVIDTKLSGLNLFQASFAKSNLLRTDLSASNLFGAEFRQAKLNNLNLKNANIHRTEIELGLVKL